jgi:hypothetical protein
VFPARLSSTWKDGDHLGWGPGCRVGGQTSPAKIAAAGLVCMQLCVGVCCSSITKFSAPLPNIYVTHEVWSIHCPPSVMNFCHTTAFSLQKTDHCTNLALGSNFLWCGDTETHVTIWWMPPFSAWLCRKVAYICS